MEAYRMPAFTLVPDIAGIAKNYKDKACKILTPQFTPVSTHLKEDVKNWE
jgi:hypothetical protein